jgi:hypothetical protein
MDPAFHVRWTKVVPTIRVAIIIGAVLGVLNDWAGNKFLGWVRRVRDSKRAGKTNPTAELSVSIHNPPHSPRCNRLMVQWVAKRGASSDFH